MTSRATLAAIVAVLFAVVAANDTAGIVTSLRVTLHVFSGTRDPRWYIQRSNKHFQEILNGVEGHQSTTPGSQLGYTAFTVDIFRGHSTSIRIHLYIFSGRPDPEWIIQLSDRNFQTILDGVVGHSSTPLGTHLGYRGFTLTITKEVAGTRTVQMLDVGDCTRPQFETLLLDTVTDLIPEGATVPVDGSLIQFIRDYIQKCP